MIPMSPAEARAAMESYHELSRAMLTDDDWQRLGDRSFVKRSGFSKLAAAYGVSTEIVSVGVTTVERDGEPVLVANAIVRATHPSGRRADGDGTCASNEQRFRRGDQRMEHNLSATAVTRAVNRAVSNLIAFGSVSAEEVEEGTGGSTPSPPSVPAWAAPTPDIGAVAQDLTTILKAMGVEETAGVVKYIGNEVMNACDRTFPTAVADAIRLLALCVTVEADVVETEGDLTRDATIADADETSAQTTETTTDEKENEA